MTIHSAISQSFLLVSGLRTVAQARTLLHRTGPRYLVVTVGEAPDHYLLAAWDFEGRVAGSDAAASLQESGLLHGLRPTPLRTSTELVGGGPSLLCVDGRLAGVLTGRPSHRGTRILFPDDESRSNGDGPYNDRPVQFVTAAFPEEVRLGETVVLAVEVGTESSPLPVNLPGGSPLDIVVQARDGFALEGDGTAALRVPHMGSTARAEFRLRAIAQGPGLVRVYVFHEGAPLGTLPLRPMVDPPVRPDSEVVHRGHSFAAAPPPLTEAVALGHKPSRTPDLSLLILEGRSDGKSVLRIRVSARDPELGLNLKEFGPVLLRMEPVEYFKDFFEDIEQLGALGHASSELIREKLESKGVRLFESIFPPELRALLWKFRERIASIQIQSEEPWIPWELCRLSGEHEGVVVEGPFFCEAFEVTRWIPEIPLHPQLTLNNMAVVVPKDCGLAATREELRYLLSLAGGSRSVTEIPARYVDVRTALRSGTYDGFHFSGHGLTRSGDPDRAAIRLEEAEELRPEELGGVMRNLGRARPLVFLNSCHGARGAFTLVGSGGWGRRYLEAGAGAFIGAYWSVSDEAACAFAQAFYQEMRAGKPLGAAVRTARLAIRTDADATWLAYTVFGESSAVVRE